jgi:hypothetical protein
VSFNPTPVQADNSKKSDSVAAGETQEKLEQAQKNAATQRKGSGPGRTDQTPGKGPVGPAADSALPWWVYAIAASVLLVVAYVVTVLVMPSVRRRKRRSGTPAVRIAGAWHQALEHLSDVGMGTARTLTAHEVARFGARAVGEPARDHLGRLGDLVNRARYSATPPDPSTADTAWRHSDEVGRLVTAKKGRPRRLARRLHPRSLTPRRDLTR